MIKRWFGVLLVAGLSISVAPAAPALRIETKEAKAEASPMLYGLMIEEINYSHDGGLYAELIRNRAFNENPEAPIYWSLADERSYIELDHETPLNQQHNLSLRWEVGSSTPTRLTNTGYWGIPLYPNATYKVSFYAKCSEEFSGPIGAVLTSKDGETNYAQGVIKSLSTEWEKYEIELKTGKVPATEEAQFMLLTAGDGTIWLNLVSLFPPTWKDRANGFRKDLMELLVELKPKFLRIPGGKYLQGNRIETRFKWQETLGPLSERPGHLVPWSYRSTDGMGLHEYLLLAEDLGAEPVLGIYAGFSIKGDYVKAGSELTPYVEEALNEIEYIIGPADSEWGAKRAAEGHPEPFPLRYIEIGNEDWEDKADTYQGRFAQFHDAITEKYPQLICISSIGNDQKRKKVLSRNPKMLDEHYYRSTTEILKDYQNHFDNYDRNGPKIIVGEWSIHENHAIRPWDKNALKEPPTPNMTAAIGDAAFMISMERNADIVIMQAYAPPLSNVNGYQWRPNLIGYNAFSAYGSPSYYALKMFSTNYGTEILNSTITDAPDLLCATTRDPQSGIIYIKLVNTGDTEIELAIELDGIKRMAPNAVVETLKGAPEDTNSIENPKKVVTKTTTLEKITSEFEQELPPYSITVIKIKEL